MADGEELGCVRKMFVVRLAQEDQIPAKSAPVERKESKNGNRLSTQTQLSDPGWR